jgi:hypothetical protein
MYPGMNPARPANSTLQRLHLAWDRAAGKRFLHFLHIPKTGGTAVTAALEAHVRCAGYRLILHGHGFRLQDVPRGEKAFFFLRDPITRFVSGFHSRQREGRPRYERPWSPGEARAFRRFATPNELASGLFAPDLETRGAAIEAMHVIQHVNSGYGRWLGDEEYLQSRAADVWFVGRQEELDEDFQRVRAALSLPDEVTLPRDDVGAHRSPTGLDTDLSSAAVDNLRAWYAADYRVLEICGRLGLRPGGV